MYMYIYIYIHIYNTYSYIYIYIRRVTWSGVAAPERTSGANRIKPPSPNQKLSCSEVYYTACFLLVRLKYSCSKLHYQKV